MLGRSISDPSGIEGDCTDTAGLGLLEADTVLSPSKTLRHVTGISMGAPFEGYEMHMGRTTLRDRAAPFALLSAGAVDGAISADGRVMGTYCHGLLASGALRHAILQRVGAESRGADHRLTVEAALDEIAQELERHLDVDALLTLAREHSA